MSHSDRSSEPFNRGPMLPLDGTGRVTRSGTYGANFTTIPAELIRPRKYPAGVIAGSGLMPPADQVRRLIGLKEQELADLRSWLANYESRPSSPVPPAASDQ